MNEKQRRTIDERIEKNKERFLKILKKNPIITVACQNADIDRTTFYRWKDDDKEFSDKVDEAMMEGTELVVDMAEAQLHSLIKEKSFNAIKYVLDHKHKDYRIQTRKERDEAQEKFTGLSLKRFESKPITMHEMFPSNEPMLWPKVIRLAYGKIWSGKYQRIIIKAPRGGGKSKLLGTLGFDMWFLKNRKVVNMGGSLIQAQIVYKYFTGYCGIDPSVEKYIQGKPKITETISVDGQYFSCVTASTRQVRGPHPDILISDETCESDDELIHAALPMVDTSENPLIILASTFHKIYGIFQETWDNADERGYLRIQWDIFDIAKEFSPDFWLRPDIASIPDIKNLVKHARGRTGDPEGWIPIENIVQAWKEKPTEDWFDIEYMGNRPSSAGLVLKPEDIDRAIFDSDLNNTYSYVQGSNITIGIDWGFSSMTSVTEFMAYKDGIAVMIDNKNYSNIASEQIIADVVAKVKAHGVRCIYADSAGKFENIALKNELAKNNIGCAVIEVVFSVEKEAMLGNLRGFFEKGKIKIPKKFKEAIWQYKRYRYQDGTDKPIKKDDHIPDSTMCALQHFRVGELSRRFPSTHEPTKEEKSINSGLIDMQF